MFGQGENEKEVMLVEPDSIHGFYQLNSDLYSESESSYQTASGNSSSYSHR